MKIATFNVENLFARARAMNLETWDDGKEILNDYSRLSKLFQKEKYTNADKTRMIELLIKLGLKKSDESKFVILRQNRGKLLKRPKSGPLQIVADGRESWIGWLELRTESVNEVAIKMTAKVIKDIDADILTVIEAEDRISLKKFNNQLLNSIGLDYRSIMLIDGNDERGIDVGLLIKTGNTVESIVSHADDFENGFPIFSRDCPEFTIKTANGKNIVVLVNHFKSKGFGNQTESNKKRKAQAQKVREIYELRKDQGNEFIIVTGDFNDTPDSDPLSPLLGNSSDLKDIFTHSSFNNDGRPGTFGNCTKSQKIDYLLLSPQLFDKVTAGGVWRKGIWGGKNGTLFPHYEEMEKPVHAASDHSAVWADIGI